MGKLNEGDMMEGIFCLALGLYIAHGTVDKAKLNRLRTQVDPKLFANGRADVTIAESVKRKTGNKPADTFTVQTEIRLKAVSVTGAFGKDYKRLYYDKSKDIGNIDRKIDQLISGIAGSAFARQVDAQINKFLGNSKSDKAVFVVTADGIAGEASGGALKGDVNLSVFAVEKGKRVPIKNGSIPFSLKSESVTVASLSPYHGMLKMAAALGVKWDAADKFSRLAEPFKGPLEQAAKFKLIEAMFKELKEAIHGVSRQAAFTERALAFLASSIFGTDMATVVDVQRTGLKEITPARFKELERAAKLTLQVKGNNLVFVDSRSKLPIFQLRTKLRPPPANEAKFYIEVAEGAYVLKG
jgi:hypothetical protein